MIDFQIKKMGTEGIPTVQALAHKIWWAHYPSVISEHQIEYMLDMSYSDAALTRDIEVKKCVFHLVFLAENPIGYLVVAPKLDEAHSYFIHKFYLDTQNHNQGLGTAVFRRILADYADAVTFRLGVNRQNYKSINFYFKNGFVIEKCLDTPIGKGYVMDDFIMVWRRGKGA